MSDSPWQSPSGSDPNSAGQSGFGQPGIGQPAPGGFGPPPPPPGPQAAGAAPGWTPPPRPGLIPLTPLGLGAILGGSFRVLRRNPLPTVGLSLGIHVVIGVITLLITGYFSAAALNAYVNDLSADNPLGALSNILPAEAGAFVVALIGYLGNAILQGIITVEVARGTLGEKLTLAGLWGKARGRMGALIGWAFLVVGVVLAAIAIWLGLSVFLIVSAGTAGIVIGIVLIVLGFLAAIAAWIWIGTKISMVPSVLMLERLTLGKAIRRSWRLTSGYLYFWRTFGIEVLVSLVLSIAANFVEAPVALLVTIFTSVANPVGLTASAGASAAFSASLIATTIVDALVLTITAIILTSTTSLLYIDLRIRKEGLDLELMRFVDARAAGIADVPDPYLPKASPAA